MSLYLAEVEERITHLVTVLADTKQEAREKVLTFDFVEAEKIAPEYRCVSVRALGDD